MQSSAGIPAAILQLPKAELHVHLEGCLTPELLVELAAWHGEKIELRSVEEKYDTRTFAEFLELFKWATSYLREPEDYARLAEAAALRMGEENCVYAEITLSVGVMLLRKQNVEKNFAAIREGVVRAKLAVGRESRVQWIFDAVRQFGAEKAMDVARLAVEMKSEGVVAFGMGGDEESLPAADFRRTYEYAASEGLHSVVHAGEMGGAEAVHDAIEALRAERIGHGIASIRDEKLMELLIERDIPLEICPQSNVHTGALSKLLGMQNARIEEHPLREFVARGVPLTLSTDDPAMFHTSLNESYRAALEKMGLSAAQVTDLAEASFRYAFLRDDEKSKMIANFRAEAKRLGLL
ncbi:MAG TPA: adenosine deaminase [Candidatus Acidoferrales bacterium]|nr:adenosine deaminase [Candidatus Acidoferrales bacterium]